MNHTLEQFIYGLDVAEVGVEEANRRWEIIPSGRTTGHLCWPDAPQWHPEVTYRRKPGLPMPKVPQATEWPADAPEWANEFVITKEFRGRYSTKKIVGRETVSRPQPPKRKIDWSKLDEFAERYCEFDEDGDIRFPSLWIPWNINSLGGDCPVPDGVRIAYHCANTGYRFTDASCAPWGEITAFRITGIADGWE